MSFLTKILILLGDVLLLNLSILLAFIIAGSADGTNVVYLIIFSNLTWLFLISVANPYSFSRTWDRPKTIKNQFIFISTHLLVVVSLIFFYDREYTFTQILTIYCLFIPAFYGSKLFTLYFIQRVGVQARNVKNILIISQPDLMPDARQFLADRTDWRYNFLGFVDGSTKGIPMKEIWSFCDNYSVDEIFVCLPSRPNLNELIDFGLNKLIPIKMMADIRKERGNSADEKHFNQISYSSSPAISLDNAGNKVIKRTFDLIFSFIFILLVMSWLFPLIGILIKLDSSGPVLFKQKRNGRKNLPFTCVKFRSMVVNKDADHQQATKGDSRITKFGQFLRKTSLDELPQFFNVFMGDMSIIGPRPHPIKLNEKFATQIEKLISRHYVKPGITGLAQAMGYRGETQTLIDMKNRITLDRFYIENWSFTLDLKIIYLTVVSLLRGSEKAY